MPAETMNVDSILERVSTGMSTERDAQKLRSLMNFQGTLTKAFELLLDNPHQVRRMFSAQLRRELATALTVNVTGQERDND